MNFLHYLDFIYFSRIENVITNKRFFVKYLVFRFKTTFFDVFLLKLVYFKFNAKQANYLFTCHSYILYVNMSVTNQ